MKNELIKGERINDKSQETDLIELTSKIWMNKKGVIIMTTISVIIGVIIALLLPNKYTSGTTFIPQMNSSGFEAPSRLSGLASLAGINLGNSSSFQEFPPNLYPRMVLSVPFRNDLLGLEIQQQDTTYQLSDYLIQKRRQGLWPLLLKYTIGLPRVLFGAEDDIEIFQEAGKTYKLTKDDVILYEYLDANLILELNDNEGFVGLSFTDEDKFVAAQVAQEAMLLLQERIIKFRNQSAMELLTFTEDQYFKQEEKYNSLQDTFAIYRDNNLSLTTVYAKIKQQRLSREIGIAASVLEQLASHVEQAKLKLNQDTPIFTIIEPAYIPYKKSSPKRSLIVIGFCFFGFLSSAGFYLLKDFVKDTIDQIVG